MASLYGCIVDHQHDGKGGIEYSTAKGDVMRGPFTTLDDAVIAARDWDKSTPATAQTEATEATEHTAKPTE